jgi:hypothetical protein
VFVGITPVRVLDTRGPTDGPIGVPTAAKLGANSSIDVSIAGVFGIPANAVGVSLNVTIDDDATAKSFLTVYPTGQTRPNASTNNAEPGLVMSNSAIFQLGQDGKLTVYNQQGSVNVIFDATGYFLACAPPTGGPTTTTAPGETTTTTAGTTTTTAATTAQPDCTPPAGSTPAPTRALTTDAPSYAAGATVTFNGTGWTGCTSINVALVGPLGSVVATGLTPDGTGAITGNFPAPAVTTDTNFLLHASGTGPECTAETTLIVTAPPV